MLYRYDRWLEKIWIQCWVDQLFYTIISCHGHVSSIVTYIILMATGMDLKLTKMNSSTSLKV